MSIFQPNDIKFQTFYPVYRLPTFGESILQWQINHINLIDGNQDIIILGDSSGMMGVRPAIMQELLNKKVWNIANAAPIGVVGHLDTLKFYLKRFSPPKLLIYHISMFLLTTSHESLKNRGQNRIIRFPKWLKKLEGKSMILPSMYLRQPARNLILFDNFHDTKRGAYPTNNQMKDELYTRRGAMEMNVKTHWNGKKFSFGGQLNNDTETDLYALFKFTQTQNIKVLIVLEPLPDVSKTDDTMKTIVGIENALRNISKNYKHVKLSSPAFIFYPSNLCADSAHLTEEGAIKHTFELSEYLLTHKMLNF